MTFWKSEEIFLDGDHFFERMIQDIDQAKQYITVEMYIFNHDELGKKIASHLIKAHERGVKVQLIVDGVGSYDFFTHMFGIFEKKGIIAKMYNPLPFYHPYYGNLDILKKLQVFSIRVLRLNKRNHRKIVTIDNNILYTGSFNFTADILATT